MVHIEVPNGKDPVNRALIRVILIGWILLELAVAAYVIDLIVRSV